jgi:hypothetical protein
MVLLLSNVLCFVREAREVVGRASQVAAPLVWADVTGFPQDGGCVEERVQELVPLEETSADVRVERLCDVIEEDLEPLLQHFALL